MNLETVVLGNLKHIRPHNRKYIGSKFKLLPFIAEIVQQVAPSAQHLADIFAGTGVVAEYFARQGFRVFASDMLYHNYLALRCFLGGPYDENRIAGLITELNALPPEEGYCYHAYGGTYFLPENAGRIDSIRERIAAWKAEGTIDDQEEAILVTSLIYAADKVANTCGHYDAYLKHLGSQPYDDGGRHRVDQMVYTRLTLGLPETTAEPHEVLHADADDLIETLETEILYLDPPYNTRQYIDNYHVLENIARWEKPPLYGKTKKFDREGLKSAYSRRATAASHLTRLIERARAQHILLSYNNEGIVPDEVILRALQERGDVEVFTQDYGVFGNGAGQSRRRIIQERLFYCSVRR